MSSRKSCLLRRISTPSVSIVTVALRLASAIRASSPKVSPTLELGELDALAAERGLAGHRALALHDDVEVVALVTLLDDHLALPARHALQALEDRLDVGRRNALEGVGLQQRRHPVIGAGALQLRLQLLDLVAAGLVPGDHDIEQVAVDRQVAHLIHARSVYLRGRLGKRGFFASGAAAADGGDLAAAVHGLEHAADEPHGALVGVALREQRAPGARVLTCAFLASAARFSRFMPSSGANDLSNWRWRLLLGHVFF